MIEHLFVYGTLAPNRQNNHILSDIDAAATWQKAQILGHLKYEGWGAALGYPALVLSPQQEWIEGFIFSSNKLPQHWEQLDQFEGEEYQRTLVSVTLENNQSKQVYAYLLKE